MVTCFFSFFYFFFFFFNDTATTEIYTLSLHDALPISVGRDSAPPRRGCSTLPRGRCTAHRRSRGEGRPCAAPTRVGAARSAPARPAPRARRRAPARAAPRRSLPARLAPPPPDARSPGYR